MKPSLLQRSPSADWFLSGLLISFSLAAIVLVGYDLLVRVPFGPRLIRPEVIQGTVEAVILLVFLGVSAWVNRTWLYGLVAVLSLVYLRRHNAELPLLTGLFYLEVLLATGYAIRHMVKSVPAENDDWTADFLLGLSTWALLFLLLSLAWLGKPNTLVILLLTGGAAALVASRRAPACVRLAKIARLQSGSERLAIALVVGWVLILGARTANIMGHDATWYLAQGDRVLAPNGSIFEHLGFSSPVHYFPKLWELMLLPITAFDQVGLQIGVGIAVLVLLMAVIWRLAREIGVPRQWCWWALWPLATLPAVANTAPILKTDALATVLMSIMCLQLIFWARDGKLSSLLYALAAGALACSTKLTAIPYVGMAFVLSLGYQAYIHFSAAKQVRFPGIERVAVVTAVMALLVALLLLARTWLLVGMPTAGPDPLIKVWNLFGWELKEPVGTLDWTRPQDWSDVPRLIYEWLLAPSFMGKMPLSWVGNFWALLLLFSLLLSIIGYRPKDMPSPVKARGLLLIMSLVGLTLAVAWRYHSRGSDGNYFMFPVLMAACLSILAITRRLVELSTCRKALMFCLLLFGFFHAQHSFITTGWATPGTRGFDANFMQKPLQPGEWRDERLKSIGFEEINTYFKQKPKTTRVVAFGAGQTPVLLPVRTENVMSIFYAGRDRVEPAENFFGYMDQYDIDYLVLAEIDDRRSVLVRLHKQLHTKAQQEGWIALKDKGGTLYSRPGS